MSTYTLYVVCVCMCVDTERHILDTRRVRNITAYNEMVCEVATDYQKMQISILIMIHLITDRSSGGPLAQLSLGVSSQTCTTQ